MRKQKGFSLIELLIVVAIILIIAAIAVPSLLRSRMLANESAAASTVRTLNTAQLTYSSTYPLTGFAATIANLGGTNPCAPALATACLIDPLLSVAPFRKSGYVYASNNDGSGPPAIDFASTANPITPGVSGNRDFCSTSDVVIHFVTPGSATVYAPAPCRLLTALSN